MNLSITTQLISKRLLFSIIILLLALFACSCTAKKATKNNSIDLSIIYKWWSIDPSLHTPPNQGYEITQWEFYHDSTVRFLVINYLQDSSIYTNTINNAKWQYDEQNQTITVISPFYDEIVLRIHTLNNRNFIYTIIGLTEEKTIHMKELKY